MEVFGYACAGTPCGSRDDDSERLIGPVAAPAAVTAGRRNSRAPAATVKVTRRLYHAEQVMQEKKLPKKKYLATQRLRRDLERSSVESLKLDVNFLRQEIANLRTVREIVQAKQLAAPVTSVGGLMAMIAQYFETIKYGFGNESPAVRTTARDKVGFLRQIMDENISFSPSKRGFEAFIAQLFAYTLSHSTFYIEPPKLVELQSSGEAFPIIVAENRLRVRLSRTTLEVIFPHTLADEVLVQTLIGQEVFYPCETRFYFNRGGKIVRYDPDVNFVEGLNAVLKSLRRVTGIMDHARLDGAVILLDDASEQNLGLQDGVAPSHSALKAAAVRSSRDGADGHATDRGFSSSIAPDEPSAQNTQKRMSIGMLLS
jgi:hypothetical protein